MAYKVNKFDLSNANVDSEILVENGTLNVETHLTFVGKNWTGYGETIAENQLHLMENFASDVEPDASKGVGGQLYFNKQEDLFYFLKEYRDDDGAITSKEWMDLGIAGVRTIKIKDNTSVDQKVVGFFDDNSTGDKALVGVFSSTNFYVHADDPYFDTFKNNFKRVIGNDGLPSQGDVEEDDNHAHIQQGITLRDGFKFHGTATTAQYADLAEMYSSDADYEPGTVVKIGGEAEVTQTTTAFCGDVFGIVSTDPAYLMNSDLTGTRVAVALEGRVPCKVIGPVKKGQRLLTSETPGVARAATDYEMQEHMDWYRIVGRALEDKSTESIGLVEVVVGAK